ncbi:MAG: right-handed parallel beta-helix repeat-containing protein, partial [Chloroflexi bacterium]|nr:right-handed parallel beta-helix repeat-containing protein [Chloroflexota bacterium]
MIHTTGSSITRKVLTLLVPGLVFCVILIFFHLAGTNRTLAAAFEPPLSNPQEINNACDPITENTVWVAGVYTATNCIVVVPVGITLTLDPGVIVKFSGISPGYYVPGGVGLIVNGTLNATGTAAEPVVFTSLKDDGHGGDTGGDGATTGTPGEWYGLVFEPGSVGRLEHFFVGYAGSGQTNWTSGTNRAQIDVSSADVQLRNGTVTSGLRKGIYLEGTDITPLIEDVQIANNNYAQYPENSTGYAIYQDSINMQPSYSGITYSGNDHNEVTININNAMTRSVTLGGTNYGFISSFQWWWLTVPDGKTLTVDPGALLDTRSLWGLAVAAGGSLIAQGTPTQPITFTSQLAAAGTPNQAWMGLWAQQGSTLRLDQCDISYATGTGSAGGGLGIYADDAQVSNCHIHHNAGKGVYLYSINGDSIHPLFTNVDVTDNGNHGVYIDASVGGTTSVTWDGGSISRNGFNGVRGRAWQSSIYPTFKNLVISDNGSLGTNDGERQGFWFNESSINPVLENLTFQNNVSAAITWNCDGSITARNLAATGNASDLLQLIGCSIGGGRQWDLGDAGMPVRVTGGIEVATNGLLSLAPGTTLAFDNTTLAVRAKAALYALGTVDKPIVFTGATETPGSWGGIITDRDRAAVVLQHCEIAYGGGSTSSSLYLPGYSGVSPSPVQIQDCEIHHSSGYGVKFDWMWTQPPLFRNNSIHDNAWEGVTNWNAPNAPPLDARFNWWGDATGPYHVTQNPGGLGDKVSDFVIFYPWLGAPNTGQIAPGQMLVSTGGPSLISPGQTVDYAIQYINLMTETVKDAVLAVQL